MKTKKRKQNSEAACRLLQCRLYHLIERIHEEVASETACFNGNEITLSKQAKLCLLEIAKEITEIREQASAEEYGRVL